MNRAETNTALLDVLNNPPLQITYLPGVSDVLVVSMAGVGTKRNVQPPAEFYRLSHQGKHHVLFISDISRSWMNGPGLAESIVRVIEKTKADHGISRVVALGNSMGGTMALLLPGLTRIHAAIAVVPQYSAKPDLVPEETRWLFFRRKIEQWPFPAVDKLPGQDTDTTILHGGSDDELVHLDRFPQAAHVEHYVFPNLGHNLARELRARNELKPILQAAINGQQHRMKQAIESAGGVCRSVFNEQRQDRSHQEMKA